MVPLSVKIRKDFGRKTKSIKKRGKIPAVVYGPKMKNVSLEVDEKEFKKVFQEAGESSLIELSLENDKKQHPVLVHDIQKDPVSDKIIHIDFYQPDLTKEVEVKIPLVFEGTASAEKDLGGTLIKNMLEIEVKALPQNLPHDIKVNIDALKTFEDHILVKDLVLPKDIKTLKNPDEIVVAVLPPQKVEEDLAVPIEEKVEEVERVEKEKKEKEEVVEEVKEEPKEPSSTSAKASVDKKAMGDRGK